MKTIKYDLMLISGLLMGEAFVIGDTQIQIMISPEDLDGKDMDELWDEIKEDIAFSRGDS